ncbi:hypothetical protein CAEBREN_10572 [Caenorhabditis brenneri]|uniref:RING-type domain-containing protein n=1 Tax=Caenorhabditis brenneri TaxID=135651 RepID=G0NDH2_CAEBE|nr:hypothetical protein CAEBREN_10572 [Caenorhabditis brenneri]
MLDRCKRDYKIGLGGITLIAVISHVRLIAANHESTVQLNSACVCVLSSTILFIFFVYPSSRHTYIKNTDNFCYYNYALHFIFIAATWIFNPTEGYGKLGTYRVFGAQLCMSIVTIQVFTLFYSTMRNRVYLLNQNIRQEERAAPQIDQNVQDQVVTVPVESSDAEDSDDDGEEICSFKTLECNVCFKRFKGSSKRRTPRILTSCGHSLCHKCLETLSGSQGYVICPTCMKKTVVPVGGVKMLQKNYIALGLLEEIDGKKRLEKKPDEKEEIFGAIRLVEDTEKTI